jgi:hypothetical protein
MNAISGALIGQRRAATLVEHDVELRLFAPASTMFARMLRGWVHSGFQVFKSARPSESAHCIAIVARLKTRRRAPILPRSCGSSCACAAISSLTVREVPFEPVSVEIAL